MNSHEDDRDLVRSLVAHGNYVGVDGDSAMSSDELSAFADMLARLDAGQRSLSPDQRAWCEDAASRCGLSIVHDNANVPRGRPVALEIEKMARPLKPPGRRA
jgi:hypothetical protein